MSTFDEITSAVAGDFVPTSANKSQFQHPKNQWIGLRWGDVPEDKVGNKDFMDGARWAGEKLKEKNFD